MSSGLGDKVSLLPTLSLNQFDWHTELFIPLLPGEGEKDNVQYCRAKSGFILIILIFCDGERRKRIRILSGRERFKVNLIGNIWNATYLRPLQIAPSFSPQWMKWFFPKTGASTDNGCYYIFIHHFTFCSLLGRNFYKSLFQMPCQRGKAGT